MFYMLLSCLLAFFFSVLITRLVMQYAIRKSILDIPNERSSHSLPTPRGGGIAIVLIFTLITLWFGLERWIEPNLIYALIGGGLTIAAVGYWDDLYSVRPRWRILLHFYAAIWSLYWLGGFPILDLGIEKIYLNWVGSLLALLGIVWCINFYNFMDGIDGLAGSEGIFIGLAAGTALYLIGASQLACLLLVLTFSIAGFTIWNWAPAKIFLGDVGSGFLGFIFATLCIYTANREFLPIAFWCIILGVFICDATFTLIYRIYQGEKWYTAHHEHAYQQLISYGAKHKQVTLYILAFNCFILLPTAYASLYWPSQSLWLLTFSIMSLWITWVYIKNYCRNVIN